MAAGQIIVPGAMPTRDRNGRATIGKLFFYEDETQTPAPVYTSSALTTQLANPVVSDAAGRFPSIWADDAELFTVVWTYDDEETIKTYSGVSAAEDAVLASVALAQAAADEAAADAVQTAADLAAIQAIEAAGSTAPAIAGKLNRNGDNAEAGLYAAIGEQTTSLTAATDVQDADLLATYRSTGPLKKLTASLLGGYARAPLALSSGTSLVGWQQAGTGAVLETVEDKLKRAPVSPAEYKLDIDPDDTASLKKCWDYATANKRTILLTGDYTVSGACASVINLASGALDIVCEGDVTITYDPSAAGIITPLFSFATNGPHTASITGGSLTIDLNNKAPIGLDLNNSVLNLGVRGGDCLFDSVVEVKNAFASSASDGASHGVRTTGPYKFMRFVSPRATDITRDASFLSSGLCQGYKISGVMGDVWLIDPQATRVTCPQSLPGNLGQDADGFAVFGRPVGGDFSVSDKRFGRLFVLGGTFTDCQGRSLKLQISNAEISRPKFVRNALGWKTINFGKEVDAQFCENVIVRDPELDYAADVLSDNFVPFTAQMGLPAQYTSYFGLFGGKGTMLSRCYHLASIVAYTTDNYAGNFKFEAVGGFYRKGTGWAAGDQFFRGLVGQDLSKLKSAAAGIVGEVIIRDTDTENVYPAYAYAGASADMADAAVGGVLRLTVENNRTAGTIGANTRPSQSISGTTIAKYAARRLVNNPGYHSVITSAVTVDFATATPGDRLVVRASDLTAVNGPTLPTGSGDFLLIEIGDIYSSGSARPSARITQVSGGAQIWATSGNGAWEQPIVNTGRVGVSFVSDADATLTVRSSNTLQVWTTALTADRAVTLSTTGARAGDSFRISRPATGAFNLNVGTGPLKALAVGQWCDVEYTGSAWVLTGFGSL